MRSLGRFLVLLVLLAACAAPVTEGDPVAVTTPDDTVAPTPTPGDTATPTPTPATTPAPTDTAAPVPDEAADGWARLADAPVQLTEVAAAPFAGAVWTAGGFDADGSAVSQVLVYDPTFDIWDEGPPLPEARHHAALVATDDGLHLLGGYTDDSFDAPTATVLRMDPATGEWAEGPALPEARAAGAAAWDGERIVYAGGVGPDGLAGEVWALEDGAWRELGELSQAREHLAAAGDGQGRVWFLGGRTGGLDANLTAVDLVAGDEVGLVGDLPTARGGVAGLYLPEVGACALGGEGPDATFSEVECMDADGAVTALPPLTEARHGLGAAVVEGVAYAVLGGPAPGLAVSPAIEALRPGRL